MSFSVVVPASSANLGPGFDSMALAVSRYMTVSVVEGAGNSRNAQQSELTDGRDMVLYAMQYLAESVDRELPRVCVESTSDIPVARGMGSSAAALVAGMLAGNRLLGEPLGPTELLKLASHIEGHADNLAAALYGGAVLAVPVESGHITVQLDINIDLRVVVLIPKRIGFTTDARAVVPDRVDRTDAVFNASRCALFVHALASGKPALLTEAMKDRWHQPYRAALYSYLDGVIDGAIRAGACGASLSGSGPTILALVTPEMADSVASAMTQAASVHELDCATQILSIDKLGARFFDA
ncbi:MAG: homoserine kinase [Thermomicrobiaceae bacterium]